MKKPNYTEQMVGWNNEDKSTGLMKYGVTHYEPVASTILKIPCPVRPPVIYLELLDHDEEPADVAAQASDSELDADVPLLDHVSA